MTACHYGGRTFDIHGALVYSLFRWLDQWQCDHVTHWNECERAIKVRNNPPEGLQFIRNIVIYYVLRRYTNLVINRIAKKKFGFRYIVTSFREIELSVTCTILARIGSICHFSQTWILRGGDESSLTRCPSYKSFYDPYAGSPTKTLLRLLLPTNDKI